jgi:hypothetical protein
MRSKRTRSSAAVALIATFLLLTSPVAGTAAGGSPIKPIDARISAVWPLLVEEMHDLGQQCQVHTVTTYLFEGNLQGAIERGTYDPLVHHPCGDYPPGTYSENATFFGTFEGTLDGLSGTFDLVGQARMNEKDYMWYLQYTIVPGSGTGELAGIHGVVKGESLWIDQWTPVMGWYRLER